MCLWIGSPHVWVGPNHGREADHRHRNTGILRFGCERDSLPSPDQVSASLLVLYGYQDFEPITQAYLIRERIPQTRICFLNRCGHLPWLEQPEAFYREVGDFLAGSTL